MKNTKKLMAALCAMTFCFSAAACGSDDSAAGESSSVQEKEMNESQKAQVQELTSELEDKELENKTLRFLSHWDINPAEGKTVGADIQMFRDKYDGKFEYISTTWENRYTDLATAVMSNEAPDFFSAMDMDGFPKGAIKSMFQPIDDYVKLDSDLWSPAKTVNDSFIYNGKHYVAAIQAEPDIVMIYNTTTIAENSLEDPADLYYKGEWTWEKFYNMCIDFTDQENEICALDGWWYSKTLGHMAGKAMIGMENGQIVNNLNDPQMAKVQEELYERLAKNNVMFDLAANNWKVRNDTTGGGVGSYETLFFPCGLWAITGTPEDTKAFGDVEAGEIMFCPIPKFTEDDKHYVTARVDGYFLCKGAPNPEGWAAFMDCRMLAKSKADNITVETLKEDSKWNDDMIAMREEMYKLVNENPVFNFTDGVSDDLSNAMQNITQGTLLTGGNARSWTEIVNENSAKIDFLIQSANENLA